MWMNQNPSQKARLAQLEADNQKYADRAKAMESLANGWKAENEKLIALNLPRLTLSEYKKLIQYQPDDALVFLAGADEVWLKEYLERLKKSTAAAENYHAGAGKSRFYRLGEFIRVLAIVILVALFIAFLALLLI